METLHSKIESASGQLGLASQVTLQTTAGRTRLPVATQLSVELSSAHAIVVTTLQIVEALHSEIESARRDMGETACPEPELDAFCGTLEVH